MTYNDGKVYKIVSKQTDKIYIGSTKGTLEERLKRHILSIKENKYISSCEIIKYDDHEIVLIELFPCCSKKALERREGEIQIENKNIIVNKAIAGRTQKEYNADNKDKITQYRIDNKDKKIQYRIDNKVKIRGQKAQQYIKHKVKIKEKNSQYRANNKDKIAKYRADIKDIRTLPFECECGSIVQHCKKSIHLKTKKHEKYILTRCQACPPTAQQPLLS